MRVYIQETVYKQNSSIAKLFQKFNPKLLIGIEINFQFRIPSTSFYFQVTIYIDIVFLSRSYSFFYAKTLLSHMI